MLGAAISESFPARRDHAASRNKHATARACRSFCDTPAQKQVNAYMLLLSNMDTIHTTKSGSAM
jgi:hypothetical protein